MPDRCTNAVIHGNSTQSLLAYIGGARFWFESFQNWQPEFFSTAMLVVLSLFLRDRTSDLDIRGDY
jgi:hypothetical protein